MIYSPAIKAEFKGMIKAYPELYPGYRDHYETVMFLETLFKTIHPKDEGFTFSPLHPTIKRIKSITLNNIVIYSCFKKTDYYSQYPFAGYEIIGSDFYFFIDVTMHSSYSSLFFHEFRLPEPQEESRKLFTEIGKIIYKNYCETYSLHDQVNKINEYLQNLSVAEQGTLTLDIPIPSYYKDSLTAYCELGLENRLVGNLWRNAKEFVFYSTNKHNNNFSSSGSFSCRNYPLLTISLKRKLGLDINTLNNFYSIFRHLFHYCHDGSKLEITLYDFKIQRVTLVKGLKRKYLIK